MKNLSSNTWNHKLVSEQGTSIFFGILFFMIAAILSIVMLSGAVTTVKAVHSDREAEQNYLTCSSAAKTVCDAITKTKVVCTEKVVVTETKTGRKGSKTETTTTTDWSAAKTEDQGSEFGDTYLKDWIQKFAENKQLIPGEKVTKTLTIQAPESGSGSNSDSDSATAAIKPVTVTLTISESKADTQGNSGSSDTGAAAASYDILMIFETGEGLDSCRMNVTLSGTCRTETTETKTTDKSSYGSSTIITTTTTTTTTTTYQWTAGRIFYGTASEKEAAAG